MTLAGPARNFFCRSDRMAAREAVLVGVQLDFVPQRLAK
jgi:hypothetical protein